MASELTSAVPLSTPDNHILTEIEPTSIPNPATSALSDEEFQIQYEIEHTLHEIRKNRWSKIALQFPDDMLSDSARVYQMLARGYTSRSDTVPDQEATEQGPGETSDQSTNLESAAANLSITKQPENQPLLKLTILADTYYGSCCVDEIAAEHVDADAVVHYGRTCLSPTSRLPVLYIYTKRLLNPDTVVNAFAQSFPEKTDKIIVMADVPYSHYVAAICSALKSQHGYGNIYATDIIQNTASLIPNRTLPEEVTSRLDEEQALDYLKTWKIFHIADPPTALLLILQSRVEAVHIFSATSQTNMQGSVTTQTNTTQILRRRYALVTSLNTVSTWGILINTLSVKNYLHIVDHVKKQIADAGKKSYLFVVGKLNPAKVANFAEIGGWIVIGCWESSLIDSREFYRPIITPFELGLVLKSDEERVWTGAWTSDFQGVLDQAKQESQDVEVKVATMPGAFIEEEEDNAEPADYDSDEESAPPEFDLRTGKYISTTRPMRSHRVGGADRDLANTSTSGALTKRTAGEIQSVNGIASPAAEFLAQKRTWRGLGTDFEIKYEEENNGEQGSLIEEGRTGVARGYTVGESERA